MFAVRVAHRGKHSYLAAVDLEAPQPVGAVTRVLTGSRLVGARDMRGGASDDVATMTP